MEQASECDLIFIRQEFDSNENMVAHSVPQFMRGVRGIPQEDTAGSTTLLRLPKIGITME
jgi:hypothetical protein